MKLHRLLAYKVYKRLDRFKEENELLKMQLAQTNSDSSYTTGTLQALKQLFERYRQPLKIKSMEDALGGLAASQDCADLDAFFIKYGSDKSTTHNYHHIYAKVLNGKRQHALQILEIGLGTNNTDVPSNMGAEGKPGASLRAFSQWAPNATIIGADVDERILFNEGRISTFYVDQTKPETLQALGKRFAPHSFDLLIDDGLHTPEANLNFLGVAIDLIKSDGTIVIEDIAERHLFFWSVVSWAMTHHQFDFVKTQSCCVLVIRNTTP